MKLIDTIQSRSSARLVRPSALGGQRVPFSCSFFKHENILFVFKTRPNTPEEYPCIPTRLEVLYVLLELCKMPRTSPASPEMQHAPGSSPSASISQSELQTLCLKITDVTDALTALSERLANGASVEYGELIIDYNLLALGNRPNTTDCMPESPTTAFADDEPGSAGICLATGLNLFCNQAWSLSRGEVSSCSTGSAGRRGAAYQAFSLKVDSARTAVVAHACSPGLA